MKKLYYVIFAIIVIIFAYHIIRAIPSFSNQISTIVKYSINTSSFSETGTFAFKSTPERSDLLAQMININSEFITNPPIEFPEQKNTIKNFYKLEKFFTDFKYYYTSKLKITDLLFNELSHLSSQIAPLSNENLEEYFSNNSEYLSNKCGINDFSEFNVLVSGLKEINGQNVISCKLEDSYFYMNNLNLLNFRIILTLEDSREIYVSVQEYMYGKNNDTVIPELKICGISGGTSYE